MSRSAGTGQGRHHEPRRPGGVGGGDEHGVALVAVIVTMVVVVLLSMTAVSQSVATLTQSAVANHQVAGTDGAEAGVQYEINQLETAGSPTCPASISVGTPAVLVDLACQVIPASGSATSYSGGAPVANSVIDVTATSQGSQFGQTQTATAQVSFSQAPGAAAQFSDALYGQNILSQAGAISLTAPGSAATADTFTEGTGYCTTSTSYAGSVYVDAAASSTTTASGSCTVQGDLYVQGNLTSSGSSYFGNSSCTPSTSSCPNVYVTGNLTISGNTEIYGNLYVGGNITLGSGAVYGGIHAGGSVTVENSGETIDGSIYSGGNIYAGESLYSGSSTNSLNAAGSVYVGYTSTSSTSYSAISGDVFSTGQAYVSGSGSVSAVLESEQGITYSSNAPSVGSGGAWVPSGKTISGCPTTSSCHATGLPSTPAFPAASSLTTTVSLPAAPTFPDLTYSSANWQGWTQDVITTGSSGCGTTQQSDFYDDVLAMSTATTPVVIVTPCQVDLGESPYQGKNGGGSFTLNSDLAIIASGGIVFDGSGVYFTSTGSLPTGQATRHLFLIVPSNTTYTGTTCGTGLPYDINTTDADNMGNILMTSGENLSDSGAISTLMYTPDSICTGGTVTTQGMIYAGNVLGSTASWSEAFDPSIQPPSVASGATTTPGDVEYTLEYVRS